MSSKTERITILGTPKSKPSLSSEAMKEVMLLSDKVDRARMLLSEISHELRDYDNRLVSLETLVEVAKSQGTRSIKSD